MNKPKFGTAGAGELFYSKGYKNSHEVPAFLAEMGLTAFEYQCGRGVRIKDDKARLLGDKARENGIALSIHAPYYISLATREEEKIKNNLRYLRESAHAAKQMGAARIVFHPGGVGKMPREEAFEMAKEALVYIVKELDKEGFGDILFCPETMGKMNQLGDLDETLKFCMIYENMLPCIDFGHMNSRLQGAIDSMDAYDRVFERIADVLGEDKAKIVHCHFSKIEYGAGGEKQHLTFEDKQYGPDYEPLMELLYRKHYTPTIICESAGTQAEDAQTMALSYADLDKE